MEKLPDFTLEACQGRRHDRMAKERLIVFIQTETTFAVPCFPTKKPKVVHPGDTVENKNVHRYGETQIRHVNQPLRRDEWKKGGLRNPNDGRPLPDAPREPPVVKRERQQLQTSEVYTDRSMASSVRSRPPRPTGPVSADFYISVPIFTETLSHSYRKKNEYVYFDRSDDEGSLYHQSLSRASSLKDVRPSSARKPPAHREHVERRRPKSLQRPSSSSLQGHRQGHHRRKHLSGSEASYNTYSSRGTYSYESERFEPALRMKSGPRSGLSLDSDEEDCR